MPITTFQYQEMLLRLNRGGAKVGPAPVDNPVESESDLHNDIIAYCKMRGWIYLHGSMAHESRRTVGEPDFTILADGGRVFFVECKNRVGKLSPAQSALHHWASRLGHAVHTVRSMKEFLEVVK